MTAINNFTIDFPNRCIEVLDAATGAATLCNRDVTLLLMTAFACFVVPFERLNGKHPFQDNQRFPKVAGKFQDLSSEKFVGSELCPNLINTWRFAKNVPVVRDGIDKWYPKLNLKKISNERHVKSTLEVLRNALAHGSIYTNGSPISELIFVQRHSLESVGFDVIAVGPEDFEKFVRSWVKFLNESGV